ncbi:MAG: ABC transporter ATP-binding protein [Lachnospiraceae bacterium]
MHKDKEWFSVHKTGFRLLKLAHSMDSSFLPLVLLELLLEVVASYAELFLSAELIDALLQKEFRMAAAFAGMTILVHLLSGILVGLLGRAYHVIGVRCRHSFSVLMRKKLLDLDYEATENPEVVDKIRFSERTAAMYGGLTSVVGNYKSMLKNFLTAATAVAMMVSLCLQNPETESAVLRIFAGPAGSALLLSFLIFHLLFLSGKVRQIYAKKEKEIFEQHTGAELCLGYLLEKVFQNYATGKVTRIFDMNDMILANTKREGKRLREYFGKMCRVENAQYNLQNLANAFFTLGSYALVALKTVTGAVTVGAFTKYTGALARFGAACSEIAEQAGALTRSCTYMKEFLEFMDLEVSQERGSIPVEKRLDGEYELAFENVSFHYPGSEQLVLKNVSCRLNMKDKMAVVGRNGAGKTTFIKLLCRLYEPTEGRITLNGVDIRKYDEEEYRDLFGVVFQDFKLFAFPVRENIVAGFEPEDEKFWECLRQAGAAELVRQMPDGPDTVLYKQKEDGVEISGGEAQKLALARALYKDAPVVILDEPTAALDPISEAQVYAGFDEMVKDKTSIYISHRMSSCRFCNDILVFQNGTIVERGSHEKLLKKGGEYAALWRAQAQYYAG